MSVFTFSVLKLALAVGMCGAVVLPASTEVGSDALLPGFQRGAWYGEQLLEESTREGIRAVWNAPGDYDAAKPTHLIVYATPNGNTIEQTLGSTLTTHTDWHFDIQHIATQTRKLRDLDRRENIVLVCVEARGLSWPAWRAKHADSPALIRAFVESAARRFPAPTTRLALTGHSGGGSFLFGYLNGADTIPDAVERIAFLDANYSYETKDRHGDKLVAWLRRNPRHRLIVVAYDDRNLTFDGKPVVGPTGGTYRASHRMLEYFGRRFEMKLTADGDFERYSSPDSHALFMIHRNPANKILHTALVGEMNGYLMAMADGTPEAQKWGEFGGPRAYSPWVEPAVRDLAAERVDFPGLPTRPADASTGSVVMARISAMPLAEREEVIEREILSGNIPDFQRAFRPIRAAVVDGRGVSHTVVLQAAPDYLSVGSNADFVRVPLTPMTAGRIAERLGCVLPTRRMVDAIYGQAELKLEPHPMTVDRETTATFVMHNAIVEGQRNGKPPGLLVAGIKKDVVQTPLLLKRPGHVAIYGWHKLDGAPIQPLTTVHISRYVDYSHGIRLIRCAVTVDGKPSTVDAVLADPDLKGLISDE